MPDGRAEAHRAAPSDLSVPPALAPVPVARPPLLRFALGFAVLTATGALAACSTDPAPPPRPDYAVRRAAWGEWREAREAYFRGPESPVAPEARGDFPEIPYFDYDSTFTLALRLSATPIADTAYLSTTGGPPRPYVPAGAIRFEAGGAENRLTVYRPTGADDDGRLFIPFTDGTSGRETYGGGRYLDLTPTASGVYVVDFNTTYHPYCVYNPAYVCPVPPEENRIPARITAGERMPPGGYGFTPDTTSGR